MTSRDAVWTGMRQAPAACLGAAACVGIIVDRLWPLAPSTWSGLAGICVSFSLTVRIHRSLFRTTDQRLRQDHDSSGNCRSIYRLLSSFDRQGWFFVLSMASLAAAWHHLHWHYFPADSVIHICPMDGSTIPVRVVGRLLSSVTETTGPTSLQPPTAMTGTRTRFRLQMLWLRRQGRWDPASGIVWVHVMGRLQPLATGDELAVSGTLARYTPPGNPGERDYARMHRSRGDVGYLRVPVPECIRVVRRSSRPIRRTLESCRQDWLCVLRQKLSPNVVDLAASLLLGIRSGLLAEDRDRFMRTGTIHLLAISGLHVGILAAPWLFAARARLLPYRGSLWCVVIMVALYAFVVEARPPVVRAGVLIQVICLSWLTRRRPVLVNSLGVAGLVVLALNPNDLFNPGTQLSFLAVAALGRAGRIPWSPLIEDPLDRLIWRTRPWWKRTLSGVARRIAQMILASFAVWLVTAPLVVNEFHLVTPTAILLNVFLCLPLTIGLQAGFAMLAFAVVSARLSGLFACICDWSLQSILTVVRIADRAPGSHFWLVGPGKWAVAGCYLLIAVGWFWPGGNRKRFACYALAFGCLLLGWSHQAWIRHSSDAHLTCTFLSVGHGTCVVLQLPSGEVWLYDAGCHGPVRTGADRVARYLWSQGISHIDALILSHADVDHFNLIPSLCERFGISRVYHGPRQLDRDNAAEAWLADQLKESGIVPERVVEGKSWQFGTECTMTVLYPYAADVSSSSDNAESVVLAIRYRGYSILLPGDLEAEGMDALLRQKPHRTDVAMAPHHGSRHSQPERFQAWCRPACSVVSGGDSTVSLTRLGKNSEESACVLHTAVHGAIEVRIDVDGIRLQPFLKSD